MALRKTTALLQAARQGVRNGDRLGVALAEAAENLGFRSTRSGNPMSNRVIDLAYERLGDTFALDRLEGWEAVKKIDEALNPNRP